MLNWFRRIAPFIMMLVQLPKLLLLILALLMGYAVYKHPRYPCHFIPGDQIVCSR